MKTITFRISSIKVFYSKVYLACLLFSSSLMVYGQSLYGPENPPPKDASITFSGTLNDGQIGRIGGKTFTYTNVTLANTTTVYWTILENTVKLSMDGADYTGAEILTFNAGLSDLALGVLTWSGNTSIPIANATGTGISYYDPLSSRFVVTITDLNGSPVNLIAPSVTGLAIQTGGSANIPDNTYTLNVRMEMFVSNNGTTWTPHLDYYDAEQTPAGAESAYSEFDFGFYWENDPPELQNNEGASVDENDTVRITYTMLSASDVESTDDEIKFIINPQSFENLPTHGSLWLNKTAIDDGDTISMTNIIDDTLSYIHDGSETILDSLAFSLIDSDTAKLFIDGDSVFFFVLNITPVDDPPSLVLNEEATVKEDSVLVINSELLQGSDPESTSENLIYTIDPEANSDFPRNGLLKLNGVPLSDGGTFTQTDLDNGRLSYDHDGSETNSDGFVFQLEDEYGHLAEIDQSSLFFFSILINNTNDNPYLTKLVTLNINEGETGIISSSNLAAADEESAAADIHFIFDPEMNFPGPDYGVVQVNGSNINDGEYFTMEDVNNNLVTYIHDGSEGHNDFFIFRVTDPAGGIAHDGEYTDFHFNISVTNVNDPPVVENPISDQETRAEQVYTLTFPETVFFDSDESDVLTYSALTIGEAALPSWLQFGNDNRTFSGTPQVSDMGELTIVLTAQDLALEEAKDTFNIKVIAPLGVSDNMKQFKVYPNPANGLFNISMDNTDISGIEIKVLNILGETVYYNKRLEEDKTQIDLTQSPAGLYFLYIKDKDKNRCHKLYIKH